MSAFASGDRAGASSASLVARRLLVYLSVILSFLFKNGIFTIDLKFKKTEKGQARGMI